MTVIDYPTINLNLR